MILDSHPKPPFWKWPAPMYVILFWKNKCVEKIFRKNTGLEYQKVKTFNGCLTCKLIPVIFLIIRIQMSLCGKILVEIKWILKHTNSVCTHLSNRTMQEANCILHETNCSVQKTYRTNPCKRYITTWHGLYNHYIVYRVIFIQWEKRF